MDSFHSFEQSGWQRAAGAVRGRVRRPDESDDPAAAGSGERVIAARACSTWRAGPATSPPRPRRSALPPSASISRRKWCVWRRAAIPASVFQEGDAEALAFPDESFDAVTLNFGVLHLARPDAALAEARRVLVRRRALRADGLGEARGVRRLRHRAAGDRGARTDGRPAAGRAAVLPVQRSRRSGAQPARRRIRAPRASEQVPLAWRLESVDGLYDAFVEGAVRTAALLKAQTPEATAAIRRSIALSLEPYRRGDCVRVADGGCAVVGRQCRPRR